jgi:mRNA interferase RelE/StbE
LPYAIRIAPRAARQLRKLAPADRKRVALSIDRLARDPLPEGCRKLKGPDGLFRIRVGSFRIVYRIHAGELVVLVLAIGNRREIYEEITRLLR